MTTIEIGRTNRTNRTNQTYRTYQIFLKSCTKYRIGPIKLIENFGIVKKWISVLHYLNKN